jgi:DNA primase
MNYLGLTTNQILNTIHRLGIHTGETKGKDLDIICPFHNDTHFGNAKIQIETSMFHCFSCGEKGNLVKLVYKMLGLQSYKQVLDFIGVTDYGMFQSTLLSRQSKIEFETIVKTSNIDPAIELQTNDIQIINEPYLQKRGFTHECINYFKIKKATKCRLRSKKGKEINCDNWMITPITNKVININTFEARKLERSINIKETFKTMYPLGSNPNRTILNIEKVPLDKDLILCEGIGGLGRLYNVFGSYQIGCLFGVKDAPNKHPI